MERQIRAIHRIGRFETLLKLDRGVRIEIAELGDKPWALENVIVFVLHSGHPRNIRNLATHNSRVRV